MTFRDPFDVLGIDHGASLQEARAAYHRLVEIYHPDRFQDRRPELLEEATRRLEEVNLAWEQVRDEASPEARSRVPDDQPRRETVSTVAAEGSSGTIFDAEIRAIDAKQPLHVRLAGPAGQSVLRALIRVHRTGSGAVQQVDWGAFELTLLGSDARRFLEQTALAGRSDSAVSVVQGPEGVPDRLSGILQHLDSRTTYRIYAENF